MNSKLYLVLTAILLVILEISFLPEFLTTKSTPNLVFALTFYLLLSKKTETSFSSAIIGGVVYDSLTGGTLGVTSVFYSIFVFLFIKLSPFYFQANMAKLFFAATFLYFYRLFLFGIFKVDVEIMMSCIATVLISFILYILINSGHEKKSF